jgi:nitrogen fixation NifU-like protein
MRGSMDDLMQGITNRISKGNRNGQEEPASDSIPLAACMRKLSNACSFARITGKCGETMEVYLRVSRDRISEATFFTDGCGFSILCGYAATKLAENRTLDEAAEIEADTILSVLKTLPQEETHCADLAAETLRAAVHEWMIRRRKFPLEERSAVECTEKGRRSEFGFRTWYTR